MPFFNRPPLDVILPRASAATIDDAYSRLARVAHAARAFIIISHSWQICQKYDNLRQSAAYHLRQSPEYYDQPQAAAK